MSIYEEGLAKLELFTSCMVMSWEVSEMKKKMAEKNYKINGNQHVGLKYTSNLKMK